MRDVPKWLEDLGLGGYAEAFAENKIDPDVLPSLTSDDLKDIGVTVVGDRRKLLNAIADFTRAGDRPPHEIVTEPESSVEHAPRPGAERRHLTLMFVDLVGSTALSERLDPEDMRDVIRAYQNVVAGEVALFEGHVAKFMGDGILVYFGWPRAHEDEAERAVRAGLAVTQAVGVLRTVDEEPLTCRIGIATGLVVVGDLVGEGAAQEEVVVGETPNLAARLQGLAEPGSVVVAPGTRRLLGDLFEMADLGNHALNGIAEPVHAWQALRESRAEGRFQALRGTKLTALVGRDEELRLLLSRWQHVTEGDGQAVLLSGEAGVGKSRITQALRERLANEQPTRLRYYCSPYHTNSALHLVIEQLERAAGFLADDTSDERCDKLEAMLEVATEQVSEVAPLFAAMLSIPTNGRYPALDITPKEKKARTLDALLGQLVGLATRQPVLMILEDAHWIDPTSAEWLGLVIDRIQRLPVLLVITFRPEFTPPWSGHAHVMTLPLTRLGRRHGAVMIEHLTGGKPLPAEVMEQILDKTDGVPLFAEELTKTVLESGILVDAGDRYELAGPLPSLAIPATLQDSLMARLDRLAPVKEVAQIGAVIGREFGHELLAATADRSEVELSDALDQLISSELVFRRGTPPKAAYSFKHALVQDAAYNSLLKSKRRQLHARLAEVLEARFPETVETKPELLAQHFTGAELFEQAAGYWSKAGERAIQSSANLEAINQLNKGLECLMRLPEGRERDQQELAMQIAIGGPLIAIHGYAASQVGEAYGRARVLCERLGETQPLVAVLSGEFVCHFVRADYRKMRLVADESRRLSERLSEPTMRLASHRLLAMTAMHSGDFLEARSEFEQILQIYDPTKHRSLPVHYVHDPKISALTYLASILWILGFPEQARRSSAAASQYARELDQVNLTAHVWIFSGAGLDELLRDASAVRAHADRIVNLSQEHGLNYWLLSGLILRGWALAQEGKGDEGVVLIRQTATERAALGVGWYQIRYLCMLAETYLAMHDSEAGLQVVAEAKDLMERNQDRMWQAELERIEGELLFVDGAPPTDTEARFERALAIACDQSAKSFELRAATSLARLRRDNGMIKEARDLLTPIYGWFTEGFDTPDLKDAKALLDELL